jgi:hypothetical protein
LPQLLYALFLVRSDHVRGNWRNDMFPKLKGADRHLSTKSNG